MHSTKTRDRRSDAISRWYIKPRSILHPARLDIISLDITSERKISILRRVASLDRAWLDIIKPLLIMSSEA